MTFSETENPRSRRKMLAWLVGALVVLAVLAQLTGQSDADDTPAVSAPTVAVTPTTVVTPTTTVTPTQSVPGPTTTGKETVVEVTPTTTVTITPEPEPEVVASPTQVAPIAPQPPPAPSPSPPEETTPPSSVYYKNCDAARAAGAAPVYLGDPGYAKHLDRDGDGVGCEN